LITARLLGTISPGAPICTTPIRREPITNARHSRAAPPVGKSGILYPF
jgi:hypothetical protein